ncbi:hypothetical protein [Halococcus sp. IIIV-5B]|uniref:hypothetical protein n=1 Tax=Halococcus sp. IIIV-5B TaxID=2321230 RepID=UPI000E75E8DB|nr:hypothetical protein [Halococcus sp. IIIV-5B]RJT07408.1 hypothetical protein D3261_01960 [Halococcus sp. IIIV-5B]
MREVNRREFLAKGGAIGATIGAAAVGPETASPVTAASSSISSDDGEEFETFGQPGSPSREAYRALAEAERAHQLRMRERQQQQGNATGNSSSGSGLSGGASPNFSRTVNAVEDLGCDPNGGSPIDDALSSVSDGTLVEFPAGNYALDGQPQITGSTVGIAGVGYENASGPPEPGSGVATITANSEASRINLDAESGLIANFVLDMTSSGTGISIVVGSSGFATARDIRVVGVQDNTGSQANEETNHPLCALMAESGATARAERVASSGSGVGGSKNKGGVPVFWVGDRNDGTAQLVDCQAQGAADNGLYGSRTPGDVQVVGGTFVNNAVDQLRYCGEGSFADGVTMGVDIDSYDKSGFNEEIATMALKVEQPSHISKPGGAVLRNAKITAVSANKIGAVINVRGHGGALKLDNCEIESGLDVPFVDAAEPGSSYDPESPPPHNITITNSLFKGSGGGEIVRVSGRPQSTVTNTCFQVSGASESSLSGITVGEGVGFGEQCQAGLSNPGKVGSGNISALGNVSVNASANGSADAVGTQTPQRNENNWIGTIAAGVMQMIVIVLLFLSALAVLFLAVFKKLLDE